MLIVGAPLAAEAASKAPAVKPEVQKTDISGEVTQSYSADPSVQIGMVVKLKDKDPKTVVPLDAQSADQIVGIVIPSSNATIVLTPQSPTTQQVLVTNNGHVSMLVSNQNGPIKTGDFIMVSSISGIGMKADTISDTQVIGKAAGDFKGTVNVIGTIQVQDTNGKKTSVSIGRIPIDVAITHNPLFEKNADYVPAGLAKITQVVASHPVSAARVYLGGIILIIAAYVTASIVYSGIRNGMVSIGRNPLSKRTVMKGLSSDCYSQWIQ